MRLELLDPRFRGGDGQRSVFSTGLFGEGVQSRVPNPVQNSAKRLLASFPGQDREPAEQTEQANCATLEQLMTF